MSYAHEDADLLERLLVVLKPLVREGRVDVWADPQIGVARRWNDEIEGSLVRAEVAILLISADFLFSDYIMDVELPRLIARGVPLVCVPAGDCAWKNIEAIASVQWALPPERPLWAMDRAERDSALVGVYEALEEVASNLGSQNADDAAESIPSRPASELRSGRVGRLLGVPPLPIGYQPRPTDLAALKSRIRASADVGLVGKRGSSGLHGLGGVGKSVLASALCHDVELRSWFPDGILWVSVGESADLVGIQRQLAHLLGADIESTNPVSGLQELRRLFGDRRCLVVVDDVWSTAAAEALGSTAEQGRMLYTTRDSSVLVAIGASAQAVDVLDPAESFLFLERAAGAVDVADRVVVERLVAQTGGVMLALSLVAAVARAGSGWADLAREMEALSAVFRDHPYADVFKAMRVAVDTLEMQDAERYGLLGVFPEDVAVPQSTVARLWGIADASPSLGRLAAAGLLAWTEGWVRFHDLQRAFVIFDAPGPWAVAHRHLLDMHRPSEGWAYLPDDEPYLWDHLIHHLEMAGEHSEMAAVASSGRWLARRVHRDGPYAAELDVVAVQPHDPAMAATLAVLRRWAPLFSKDLTQSGVAASLVSRLPSAERESTDLLGGVWLRPAAALPEPTLALLRSLTSHTRLVNAVAFSDDGRTLASAGSDGIVRLWNTDTGAELLSLTGHTRRVNGVAFATSGRLASAGSDGTVRLWNAATGAEEHVLTGHTGRVNAVTFAPDGDTLASGGSDGTVRLWSAAIGGLLRSLVAHAGRVNAVAFSSDGRTVASAGNDSAVRLWNADNGIRLLSLAGHTGGVKAVAFAPDGHTLAGARGDGSLRLWDSGTGAELRSLTGHAGQVNTVAFAPDGLTLASAGNDGTVRLWTAATGAELRSFSGHTRRVNAVDFAPDGRTLASAGNDGTVRLWTAATAADLPSLTGHSRLVSAVEFAPDGRTLVSAGFDGTVRLWDGETGAELRSLAGHTGLVKAVAFSPDGHTLASADNDGTVRLWNAATGAELRSVSSNPGPVDTVAFAPDGRSLASAGGSDGTVRRWNAATGAELRCLIGHTRRVNAVAFAPDGHTLASGGSDGTVRLWNTATGAELRSLSGHTGLVGAVAFAPDGRTLASGGSDGSMRLWNAATGAELRSFIGHTRLVNAVDFAPDGHTLASGASDGTVRLWNASTGTQLAALGLGEPVRAIDWAPDGTVVSAAFGTTVARLRLCRQDARPTSSHAGLPE